MDFELSLIAPALNEECNIAAFCDMLRCDLAPRVEGAIELIFIDDGSTDESFERMREATENCQDFCTVKAIRFSRNFGKEAAIYAGLQQAQGNFVGIIDVDLQQTANDLANMLELLKASPHADCVAAVAKSRKKSRSTAWLSKRFYHVLGKSSHMDIIDNASDFRVFRASIAQALLDMPEYYRFSKGLFAWVGFSTIAYEYTPAERHAGETNWTFGKLAAYALDGILSFTTTPLRLATYAGTITSVLAAVYAIVLVIRRLIYGIDVPGYASIAVLVLFFGGFQLLILGIIGEYLGRLYIENKQRPQYIVREIVTTKSDHA